MLTELLNAPCLQRNVDRADDDQALDETIYKFAFVVWI